MAGQHRQQRLLSAVGGASYSHARGISPSADRTATEADNVTTFYATNMTPQLQTLNGGRVAVAGGQGPRLDLQRHALHVVTGAWVDPNRTPHYAYDSKGRGKACPVPTHYWKVLLRSRSQETPENRYARASGLGTAKHRILDGPRRQELVERRIERLQRPRNRAAHGLHVLRERPRRSRRAHGTARSGKGSDPQFPGLVPTYDTTRFPRGLFLLAPYPFSVSSSGLRFCFRLCSLAFACPVPTLFSA